MLHSGSQPQSPSNTTSPPTTSLATAGNISYNTGTSKSAIAGGVVGGLVALAILILALRFRHQRRCTAETESTYRRPISILSQMEAMTVEIRRAHGDRLPSFPSIPRDAGSVNWSTTVHRRSTEDAGDSRSSQEINLRWINRWRTNQQEHRVLANANGQQLQRVHGQLENQLTVLQGLNMVRWGPGGGLEQWRDSEPPPSYQAAIESRSPLAK